MPTDWNELLEYTPPEYKEMYQRTLRANQVLTTDADPEVAPTPKELIWTRNKTKLYRYISESPKNIRFLFFWCMPLLINLISWI